LVQVRSPDEIEATLDEKGMNRGLSFDREMLPYCGRTVRVKDTVDRIIDDRTGRMLKIPGTASFSRSCLLWRAHAGMLVLPARDIPLLARGLGAPRRGSDRPEPADV
jgi:hypothetical protein